MSHPRLHYLAPTWFAIPMGLCGLALAWHRAAGLMGEPAEGIALVLGALAGLVFLALAAAAVLRLARHPQAWAEDRAHPVRHAFLAAIPVAALLLATVAQAVLAPDAQAQPLLHGAVVLLWWAGSLGLFGATLWTLSRWWAGNKPGGLVWPVLTPALFIPVVGNVLAPLAGVALGSGDWAAAQLGIGLLLWPVLLTLLLVRLATQGPWPERLLPANLILLAPPAVIGSAALQLGAPPVLAWACWGIGLFMGAWVLSQARRMIAQPFGLAHWGLSFPLAAFAALTLRLAEGGGLLAVLGPVLLAAASLVVLGLAFATWRGLRDGSLLKPEAVASLQPVGQH